MIALTAPYPPVIQPVNTTGQLIMAVGTTVVMLLAVAWTLRLAARRKQVWPVVIVVSAGFCSLMEAIYDNAFNLWFYTGPDVFPGYDGFGIHVAWWVSVTYVWVYGVQAVWLATRIDAGASRRDIGRYSALLWCVFTAFEMVGTNLGTYGYFGEHPYRVAGFPIWVSVANTAIVVVAAALITRLRPLLPGARAWAMIVLVPAAFALGTFTSSFPTLEIISHPDPNPLLMWVSATVSMVLGAVVCYLACLPLPAERTTSSARNRVTVPASH
jgi:hypothetical protein